MKQHKNDAIWWRTEETICPLCGVCRMTLYASQFEGLAMFDYLRRNLNDQFISNQTGVNKLITYLKVWMHLSVKIVLEWLCEPIDAEFRRNDRSLIMNLIRDEHYKITLKSLPHLPWDNQINSPIRTRGILTIIPWWRVNLPASTGNIPLEILAFEDTPIQNI